MEHSPHAGCNVGRERTRVGTVVPRGGQRSGPVVQEFPFCHRKCDPLSSCCLEGVQVWIAWLPSGSRPHPKRHWRVESSSPQSGSMDGLEEDLGAVAPTEIDPATTPVQFSTVPASSRALREVHAGNVVPHSVPVPPTGQIFKLFRCIDREEEDPQFAQVDEPPRLHLRLSQVSDIMADQQVFGSDTESIDGHLKARCLWWMFLTRACWVLLCLDQSSEEKRRAGPVWTLLISLKEVFGRRASVMRTVPLFQRGVFSAALRLGLQQIINGGAAHDPVLTSRAWNCSCECFVFSCSGTGGDSTSQKSNCKTDSGV